MLEVKYWIEVDQDDLELKGDQDTLSILFLFVYQISVEAQKCEPFYTLTKGQRVGNFL